VKARLGEIRGISRFQRRLRRGAEEQARAFAQLQMMLILAIVLVYAVMASQYESLRDPFIIMFSVPLAAIGVVLALKLTGTRSACRPTSASSCSRASSCRTRSAGRLHQRPAPPRQDAAARSGRDRRPGAAAPILMTSIATVLGLVPMSLGIGEGAELQAPLARVVIGG
jgi:HAE1 family hydrophobic/amphiphilic exporter-1